MTRNEGGPLISGKKAGALIVFCIVLVITLPGIRNSLRENGKTQKQQSGPPTHTLGCAENDSQTHLMPNASIVVVVVPPLGNCWTPWQTKSQDSLGGIWEEPDGEIKAEWYYNDDTTVAVDDNPRRRVRAEKPITAVRFRNTGPQPVKIKLVL